MLVLIGFDTRGAATIRAEMRELHLRRRLPVGTLLLGLLAAASTASTVLTLASF